MPQDPFTQDLGNRLKPPFWMEGSQAGHLLGTDQLGRDYLARLVYGARISLLIGIMTVITSGPDRHHARRARRLLRRPRRRCRAVRHHHAAVDPGGAGRARGGRADGSGSGSWSLTLGLLLWDRFAVVARATTMQVRNLDYVSAAWCAGASTPHILIREILPNIASHLAVVATLEMALAILLEAALSFLGLGVPPPLPSWGLMIAEGKDYMFFSPWVIMIPGVALFVLVLGINLVGDGLRDLLGAERLR